MSRFFYFIISSVALLTLIGAGCASGGQPINLAYLKDALEFSKPSGRAIPVTLPTYVPPPPAPPAPSPTIATTSTSTPTGQADAIKGNQLVIKPTTIAAKSASVSYLQALGLYRKTGYYFQFFNCHGTPGSMVVKQSARFMLDNRDRLTRTIAVGKRKYTIPAFDFVITAAPDISGTYYITCNGGGAATLKVEQ